MTLIERSNKTRELWEALIPHIAPPDQKQFVIWANRFPDELIERALMRTQRRFALEKITSLEDASPVAVHRYVTGLLLNLERDQNGPQVIAPHSEHYQRVSV